MLSRKKLLFLISLLANVAVLTLPASTWAAERQGGNDHGGGGNLTQSTKDQVREAITSLILNMLDPTKEDRVNLLSFLEAETPDEKRAVEVLDWIGLPYTQEELKRKIEHHEKVYFDWKEYFGLSHLELLETGGCKGISGHEDTDASVSAMEYGATICFSLERLQRIPPQDLQEVLFPLVLHEMAHLNKFGEEDANRVQNFAIKHSKIEQKLEREHAKKSIQKNSQHVFDLLTELSLHRRVDLTPKFLYFVMGSIDADLNSIQNQLNAGIHYARLELAPKAHRRIEELRILLQEKLPASPSEFQDAFLEFEQELLLPLLYGTSGSPRNKLKFE